MARWRDIKAKALGKIHRSFSVPAVYLMHSGADPLRVEVRVHLKNKVSPIIRMDDWTNAASDMIQVDRIIFETASLAAPLKNGAFVVVSSTEVYRLGPSEPDRDGYTAVEVSEVKGAERDSLLAAQDTSLEPWDGVL